MTDHDRGLLWTVVDRSFEVDYELIQLVDDEAESPDLPEVAPQDPDWVTSGPGWLVLRSGGSGHYPTVTMQAWEKKPPAGESWGDSRQLLVSFESDMLRLVGTASGPSLGPAFVLPPGVGLDCEVRIYRASGTENQTVEELVVAAADDEGAENGTWGLESWLLQFWPRIG